MSVVYGVLKDEYDRLLETEQAFLGRVEKLPKGSIQKKKINGCEYIYLSYRDGSRVKSTYIGSIKSGKVENTLILIEKREQYKKRLKETRASIKEIEKVLNG
jgi:hypothetical protein